MTSYQELRLLIKQWWQGLPHITLATQTETFGLLKAIRPCFPLRYAVSMIALIATEHISEACGVWKPPLHVLHEILHGFYMKEGWWRRWLGEGEA